MTRGSDVRTRARDSVRGAGTDTGGTDTTGTDAGAGREVPAQKPAMRSVGDVMTHAVIAVGRDATFKEITEKMHQWRVSAVPVVEADVRVIGVVSEADLLAKEEYRNQAPGIAEPRDYAEEVRKSGALTAGDLMTSPAVAVREDAQLTEAARIMARKRVKRLPVVDGTGRLTGIVSRSDLLKVFLRSDGDIADEIEREVLDLLPGVGPSARVQVEKGVATVSGHLEDASLVPVLARLIRSVEGVVDVEFDLD